MHHFKKTLFCLGLYSLLTACSSGGGGGTSATSYDGTTDPATITDANAKSLSVSSTEAAKQANSANTFSSFKSTSAINSFKTGSTDFDLDSLIRKTTDIAVNQAVDVSANVCSSGSISLDGVDQNTNINNSLNVTIRYNNCTLIDIAPTTSVNGTARFQGFLNGNFTIVYSSFTINQGGVSDTINMTISCSSGSCTASTDFTGSDARTYRVQNFEIYGSSSFGYYVSGRVYDPDNGYIDISTTTGITFNCPNGVPGTGIITLTDHSANTATIHFDSCTQYTVSVVGGLSNQYDW